MMKEYSFQMTKEEVRELCFRAIWEQQRLRHFKWLWLPAGVLALECAFRLWAMALMVVIILLMMYAFIIVWNNSVMKKQLYGKTRTMQVEDGVLKASTEGSLYTEIPCRSCFPPFMRGCMDFPRRCGHFPYSVSPGGAFLFGFVMEPAGGAREPGAD